MFICCSIFATKRHLGRTATWSKWSLQFSCFARFLTRWALIITHWVHFWMLWIDFRKTWGWWETLGYFPVVSEKVLSPKWRVFVSMFCFFVAILKYCCQGWREVADASAAAQFLMTYDDLQFRLHGCWFAIFVRVLHGKTTSLHSDDLEWFRYI